MSKRLRVSWRSRVMSNEVRYSQLRRVVRSTPIPCVSTYGTRRSHCLMARAKWSFETMPLTDSCLSPHFGGQSRERPLFLILLVRALHRLTAGLRLRFAAPSLASSGLRAAPPKFAASCRHSCAPYILRA